MGIFRKLWKGVKRVFKKVGKGVKKVFVKVGKFMDKIGIVGQIALMFILPGLGNALMKGMAWATKMGAAMTASQYAIVRGAGAVLNTALKFATTAGNVYRTVSGAVTDFIGTAGKYIGGKMQLPGFENMSLGEAWSTYSNEVMKNVSSIADPWKQAVTIDPAFGSTVADQAKAVGMSPEQFVENYTMPENVAVGLEGLSGKELANFKFDSITTFKPGQGPTVAASITTPITEPFQAVRKTDFWGFAPEVVHPPGTWIPDPKNPGQLIQVGQGEGVTKGIIPAPVEVRPVEVRPVEVRDEDLSLLGSEYVQHSEAFDPVASGLQTEAGLQPLAEEELSLYQQAKDYLRPVPQQMAAAVGTQLILGEFMGDPPIPEQEEYFRGGIDYGSPSDSSLALRITQEPLVAAGPTPWAGTPFLSGANIDPTGSVNAFTAHHQKLAGQGVPLQLPIMNIGA